MKKYLLVAFFGLIGGAISFLILAKVFLKNETSLYQPAVNQTPVSFTSGSVPTALPDFILAVERSVHAVVHVKSMYKNQMYSDPVYSFFFGDMYQRQTPTVQTAGSGVIITNDGYIVTNNHVIQKVKGSVFIEGVYPNGIYAYFSFGL